jgi:hypothetical protein
MYMNMFYVVMVLKLEVMYMYGMIVIYRQFTPTSYVEFFIFIFSDLGWEVIRFLDIGRIVDTKRVIIIR